mgnify:CR=1 FL=1
MNIIEKYIEQKKNLIIIISCLDIKLAKKIADNLSLDLMSDVKDIYKLLNNNKNEELREYIGNGNNIIIVAPFFPMDLIKLRVSYHININLGKKGESEIDKQILNLKKKFSDKYYINKFINLKEDYNEEEIEEKIYNLIINYIKKKLDHGKYLERVNSSENSSDNSIDSDNMGEIFEEINDMETIYDKPIKITADDINIKGDIDPLKDFNNNIVEGNFKGKRQINNKIKVNRTTFKRLIKRRLKKSEI